MTAVRAECKTPGGKLVGVRVTFDGKGEVRGCHLDGDFFLDGDDAQARRLVADIEAALVCGASLDAVAAAHPGVRMVGTDMQAIRTAYGRALSIAGIDAPMTGAAESAESACGPSSTTSKPSAAERGASQSASVSSVSAPSMSTPSVSTDDAGGDGTVKADAAGRGVDGRDRAHARADEYERRWRLLSPVVIHDRPRDPEEQMDTDLLWSRQVAAGSRPATLRIWEWASPAVVIGRFQSLEDEVNVQAAKAEGFSVVRRCTGGGAMFIEPGNTITYSLMAPLSFVDGVGIEESYRLCDHWLVSALRQLGLDVRFSGLNDIASQHGKIGGAAQRRFPTVDGGPGAVLHHVTLAYDIDAEKMATVLNTSREKMSDKAVKSAVRRVDPLRSQTRLGRDAIIDHFIGYLEGRSSGRRTPSLD